MQSVIIDGVEFVKKEDNTIVEFTGEETVASRMIGKNVIVRSYNEGINVGTVVMADETCVELKNVRRLWYHKPKDKTKSWYEGVAVSGISSDSKISCTVPTKVIIEKYSMTVCNDQAYKSIMEITPHERS